MTWYRLARQIGGCTVAELKARMSSKEFQTWRAFEIIEPGEPLRSDYHAAFICERITNMLKGKKGRRARVKDFLLRFTVRGRSQTQQEIRAAAEQWLKVYQAGTSAQAGRDQ